VSETGKGEINLSAIERCETSKVKISVNEALLDADVLKIDAVDPTCTVVCTKTFPVKITAVYHAPALKNSPDKGKVSY
jgi:hypothetical protein